MLRNVMLLASSRTPPPQLLPTVEAIKQANNITIEEAKKYEAEIQASLPEPVTVEALPKTENL